MEREYTTDKVPDRLKERIQASAPVERFRRRAVLTKGNARWELVCCTVESFVPGEKVPEPARSRSYQQALLYEDFLTAEDCLKFAHELQKGHAWFGDIELERGTNVHWTGELVPVANDYMERAGWVISLQFTQSGSRASVRTLLAADQPYYPDADEATRDWLPLRVYHGHSDSRNDRIIFLLPETRAFFTDAALSGKGTLDVTVAGTEISSLSLLVKGAYWEGKALHHIEAQVKAGKATLIVPDDVRRLEYYLIDQHAVVYDFHRADRFFRNDQERRTRASIEQVVREHVRTACRSGEGMHVEFKPFVDPSDKQFRKEDVAKRSRENTKLRQVIETVAAFSNTEGGRIYLGIHDDCTIYGIGENLRAWAGEELSNASIERYLGALKSKIKDFVHGEVALHLSHAEIDGMLVGIIEVSPAAHGPVALQQEFHLYVRSGASNRKAPPEQWKTVLKADKQQG